MTVYIGGNTAAVAGTDSAILAQDAKFHSRIATVTDGALATAFANGQTADGVVLATGNRILLKEQTDPIENGLYTVNAAGAPTRATDWAIGDTAAGFRCIATEGTANADTGFLVTNNDGSDVVGTDGLVFIQYTSSGGAALAHAMGGVSHTADTLANFNLKITDGNVIKDVLVTKTAFVSTAGSDSTGALGDASRPFLTLATALALGGVELIKVMSGTYAQTTMVVPAGVVVEAFGGNKHAVIFDFTGASADAITLGIASELIGISFIGFTMTTSANFWGVLTDECTIRGCKFAIYDEAHVWKNITNDGALNVTFEDNLFIAADGTIGAAVGLTILKLDSGTRASTNLRFIDNVIKLDEAAANLNFEPRVFAFAGGDGVENLLFRGNRVTGIQGTVLVCNASIVTGEIIFHQNEFRGTGTFSPIFLSTSSSGDDARISVTENSGVCTTSDGNHFVSVSTNSQSMILVSDNNIKGFNNILLSAKSGANDNDSISVNHNSLEGCSALVSVSVSAGAIQSLQIIGNNYIARATGGAGISIVGSGVADLIKNVVISENTFRYPGAVTIAVIAVKDSLNVRITDNQVHATSTMGNFIQINSGTEDVEYLLIDGNKVFEVAYQAGSQFASIAEAKSIVITNNMTTNVGACLNIETVLGGSLIIADNFFEECGGTASLPAIDVAVFTAADLLVFKGNTLTSTQNAKNAVIFNGVGAAEGQISNNTIRFTGTTTDGIVATALGASLGDYVSSNNFVDVTGIAYNYSANVLQNFDQ